MFIGLLKSWTRFTSFIGKEVTEVVRRPGALFSLVLGPFLIMALFGMGYSGQRRPLETVLVVPASTGLPREAAYYQQFVGEAVQIAQIAESPDEGRQRLMRQNLDLLVIAPPDMGERFRNGEQTAISVEYNLIDPLLDNYARFVAYRQVQELNRILIEQAVGEGVQYAVETLGAEPPVQIPPEVIAAPTRAETKNWAPLTPTVVFFFAPAVLALILQHMGVTLTALAMIRERTSGAFELFRVAPVRTLEILVGKYLAYGFFNLAIGALISFLLVGLLRVPLLGNVQEFATVVLLLTFASLGLGLLISTVVDSERQAVQISMLVLLASVFFSGFVLPLDEFLPFARALAFALPVTHGILLLQDIMLRGGTYGVWHMWALVGIGVTLFLVTGLTLRRKLRAT